MPSRTRTIRPTVKAATAFLTEFDRVDINMQRLIRHALLDLQRRCKSLGSSAWAEYDTYSSLSAPARAAGISRVLKVDLSGGCRMLVAAAANQLTLLAFGPKNTESQWDRIKSK